ncbi:hypothetical protein [Thalassoroseus pseudoceratinae]|uniref:hypothetical protein n=1 Tax=Thalassoroseus pseudoceratinae TaxID=2713176 RepID=UPI00141FE41E|nr:hypothetical protein [Thalassoroseus pseudoceratinae]
MGVRKENGGTVKFGSLDAQGIGSNEIFASHMPKSEETERPERRLAYGLIEFAS